MSDADSLVAFLLAQYDADEHLARAAQKAAFSPNWDADGIRGDLYASSDDPQSGHVIAQADKGEADVLDHAARHDPASVLADIAAKRQIVALHPHTTIRQDAGEARLRNMYGPHWEKRLIRLDEPYCDTCHVEDGVIESDDGRPCLTLRLLASPYASRDGYKESWRP